MCCIRASRNKHPEYCDFLMHHASVVGENASESVLRIPFAMAGSEKWNDTNELSGEASNCSLNGVS